MVVCFWVKLAHLQSHVYHHPRQQLNILRWLRPIYSSFYQYLTTLYSFVYNGKTVDGRKLNIPNTACILLCERDVFVVFLVEFVRNRDYGQLTKTACDKCNQKEKYQYWDEKVKH